MNREQLQQAFKIEGELVALEHQSESLHKLEVNSIDLMSGRKTRVTAIRFELRDEMLRVMRIRIKELIADKARELDVILKPNREHEVSKP